MFCCIRDEFKMLMHVPLSTCAPNLNIGDLPGTLKYLVRPHWIEIMRLHKKKAKVKHFTEEDTPIFGILAHFEKRT